MTRRNALLLTSALGVLCATAAYGADPDTAPVFTIPGVEIVGQRLDAARSQLQPALGATSYKFDRTNIETLPQGDNAPLNQTLLQAPGVAQDSFGQIHVLRGDQDRNARQSG